MREPCSTDDCHRDAPAGHDICLRCQALQRGDQAQHTRTHPTPHQGHRTGATRREYPYEHDTTKKYTNRPPKPEWDERSDTVYVNAEFFDAYIWRPDPTEANLHMRPDRAHAQLAQIRDAAAAKHLNEQET